MPNTRVLNLTFHGIGSPARPIPPEEVPMWISQAAFNKHLDAIARRSDVRITFDDGNASDVTIALPALLSRGLKAAFFVLAGRLTETGSLTPRDLITLRKHGMVVGLHGMDHRAWRGMSAEQLQSELVDARSRIEDVIGEPITWAACPFGAYGRRALGRLRKEGFERVFTSDQGLARRDAWLQPRNTLRASCSGADATSNFAPRQWQLKRWAKILVKQYAWP